MTTLANARRTLTRDQYVSLVRHIAEDVALLDSVLNNADAPHDAEDVLATHTRQAIIELESTLSASADAVRRAIAHLDTTPTPDVGRGTGGFTLHEAHRDTGQAIRRAAERALVALYGRGRPVIVANLVAAHRDEYDAIARDLVANPGKATA